jgi:hypothetical protein
LVRKLDVNFSTKLPFLKIIDTKGNKKPAQKLGFKFLPFFYNLKGVLGYDKNYRKVV